VVGLALGAIGVVFGDIGTSPLYAMQTVFSIDNGAVKATPDDVYGVISLVFWSITLIVSIKYVDYILRADNDGEGGIVALAALIRERLGSRSRRVAVAMILGAIGASLFYGDSLITPATYIVSFVGQHPNIAFIAMGAVVLSITGVEALYADMGHSGSRPIRMSWSFLVFPALVINLLDQGALILDDPTAISNPGSPSNAIAHQASRHGESGCSSASRTTPPAPPHCSTCPKTGPS